MKSREEKLQQLQTFFKQSKAYYEQTAAPETPNTPMQSMRGLFSGKQQLFIHAQFAREIIESVQFAQSMGVKRIVLVGGRDAWQIPDFLKTNNIPVILSNIHRLPMRQDEPVDLPYKVPAMLQNAGILFCLDYSGGMSAMGTRNLPFIAGTARTYGLSEEQAIAAISSNTAKILGIDDTVGEITSGKAATIIVSAGDALDMKTNQIEYAFIQGREIDLNSHQLELYEQYKAKYGQ